MRRPTPWAAIALALGALTSLAAETRLEPPPLDRYVRWGPLRVAPSLTVENLGWDDNILSNPNRRVGDYTVSIGPRLEGLLRFGDRAFLTFDERLQYSAFASNGDQDFVSSRGRARVTVPLRPFGMFVEGTHERTRERPIDLERVRPRRTTRGVRAGVIVPLGWRTEVELSTGTRSYRYRDPDAADPTALPRRLDRDESGLSLEARYRLRSRLRLVLEADRDDVEFRDPATALGDARDTRILPGLEIVPGGPLFGSLLLGWQRIDSDDPDGGDFEGLVGRADATYRFSGGSRVRLRFEREAGFATFEQKRFFLDTEAGLTYVHYFSRVLGFEVGASSARLTFPASSEALRREDDLTTWTGGLRLRVGFPRGRQPVEYVLRIRRTERDSTLDLFDDDKTRIGLNLEFGF